MKLSYILVLLGAAALILSSACGGGGGSSGGGTSATATTAGSGGGISNTHIFGVVSSNSGTAVDPLNVIVGDQIQLQVAGRNSSDVFTLVNGTNWTTTAPPSVATVTSSGVLTALQSSGGVSYSLSCTGPNGPLTTNLAVQPVQAMVTGSVTNANSDKIADVIINFYSSTGTLVAVSVTGPDGTFRASVPSTATKFGIDISNADPLYQGETFYYQQFGYGTKDYLDANTACLTTLPATTVGQFTPLPNPIVLEEKAEGPPPPPSGCLGG